MSGDPPVSRQAAPTAGRSSTSAGGLPPAERLARAALTRLGEFGEAELGRLVRRYGAEATLAGITDGTLPTSRLASYRTRLPGLDPAADLAWCERHGGGFVCPGESGWPTQLADLGDRAPLGLWVRGRSDLRLSALYSVAVVGARAATNYGRYVAARLAAELGERHWTVMSGGAFGIDAAAHCGALGAGGLTVAVLACGVDVVYPSAHRDLLERIADSGLLVSAYPPRVRPARYRFLERNRLLAAITRGAVVVEAALRSGALSTARSAASLGRAVMGVPGPVTSGLSEGVHGLLREPGSTVVTCAAEVLDRVGRLGVDLAPARSGPRRPGDVLDPVTARVLEAVPPGRLVPPELICVESGLAPELVAEALELLRGAGFVAGAEGRWRRTSLG